MADQLSQMQEATGRYRTLLELTAAIDKQTNVQTVLASLHNLLSAVIHFDSTAIMLKPNGQEALRLVAFERGPAGAPHYCRIRRHFCLWLRQAHQNSDSWPCSFDLLKGLSGMSSALAIAVLGIASAVVNFFVSRLSRKMQKQIRTIPKDAMKALTAAPWPGNIRENGKLR